MNETNRIIPSANTTEQVAPPTEGECEALGRVAYEAQYSLASRLPFEDMSETTRGWWINLATAVARAVRESALAALHETGTCPTCDDDMACTECVNDGDDSPSHASICDGHYQDRVRLQHEAKEGLIDVHHTLHGRLESLESWRTATDARLEEAFHEYGGLPGLTARMVETEQRIVRNGILHPAMDQVRDRLTAVEAMLRRVYESARDFEYGSRGSGSHLERISLMLRDATAPAQGGGERG